MKPTPFAAWSMAAILTLNAVGNLAQAGTVVITRSNDAQNLPDGICAGRYPPNRLGLMQKAGVLAGKTLRDRKDKKIGTVKDLVLDLGSGRVVCALVSPSGHRDLLVGVPPQQFLAVDVEDIVVSLDKSQLVSAPEFSRDRLEETYRHFNATPYWDAKTAPNGALRYSELLAADTRNKANEYLGRIANFMVDLPAGRVIFVVISLDGTENSLYAVPPFAMSIGPDRTALLADISQARISQLAHPDSFFWTQMTDPAWAVKVYRWYGLEPEFAEPASPPTRTENSSSTSGLAQGKSDAEVTQIVVSAIMRDNLDNALAVKNLKITAVNGRVTLSGKVKNAEKEQQILAAAETVVGAANLDNQLQTR